VSVERIIVAAVIIAATFLVAGIVDRILRRRRDLPPAALTRYRALRRTIYVAITAVGLATALLVFPYVRGAAGAVLTSAAVISVIIGISARTSLGNFVSGLVLAFAQPIRIGDQIEFRGVTGRVEDVGRVYTRLRTRDGAWVQVPNDLLASDTIRNWTIVDAECTASVQVLLPLSADLEHAMTLLLDEARAVPGALSGRRPTVRVTSFHPEAAEVTVDVWVADHEAAEQVSSELRLRAQQRLREAGLDS
jgi:small-conductance mechanosensitive channel